MNNEFLKVILLAKSPGKEKKRRYNWLSSLQKYGKIIFNLIEQN